MKAVIGIVALVLLAGCSEDPGVVAYEVEKGVRVGQFHEEARYKNCSMGIMTWPSSIEITGERSVKTVICNGVPTTSSAYASGKTTVSETTIGGEIK